MSRLNVKLIGAVLWIAAASGQARADIIETFDLTGKYQTSSPRFTPSLTGSVTIDVTNGVVQSQTIFPSVQIPGFFGPPVQPQFSQGYDPKAQSYFFSVTSVYNLSSETIYFDVVSLINYMGGPLGSLATPTLGGSVGNFGSVLVPPGILISGSATLQRADVPEPGSVTLLTLGIVGLMACRLGQKCGRRRIVSELAAVRAKVLPWETTPDPA